MLPKRSLKLIGAAIDRLFARAKARLLGQDFGRSKDIVISARPEETLPGLYSAAIRYDGGQPKPETIDTLNQVVEGYLDAVRDRTKAQVVHDVTAVLRDAKAQGTETDVPTVLGGVLADTWGRVTSDVHRIVTTEAQHGKAIGALEGLVRIATINGVDDPVIFFIVVHDQHLCEECRNLHLLKDGQTPRVWKLSEVSNGYHRKGDSNPSIGGLHPHCRCSKALCLPGWGFVNGLLTYRGPDWDEYAHQRSL